MEEIDQNRFVVELVKEFSKPIVSGATNIGKGALEKLRVNLDLCFRQYLVRSYQRYSKTKTLLYREVPVNLKDFYIRSDLMLGRHDKVDESEFLDHIEGNRRVVVSGTAGSGKSTLCKSILIELIENNRGIVPVFIELRHIEFKTGFKFEDYLVNELAEFDSSFTLTQLKYSLSLGKILVILDGFDEIDSNNREEFEKSLILFSNTYSQIMILVSSRPDSRFGSWEEFYQYNILPLDKNKAMSLVSKLDYDKQIRDKFLKELDRSLFEKHESFANNPLLLIMMLLTYEQIAEIPSKIHLFYEQAFLTLFSKHDSLKSLYKRKSFTGLPLDEFKKLLSSFSILTYNDKKYHFTDKEIIKYINNAKKLCQVKVRSELFLQDLVDSVCILQRDGLGYTFTHRSFQEYFTALFVVEYVAEQKFELLDKVAFINDRDDVIPMIYDINRELVEQEWVVPRITKMINDFSEFPQTQEGKLRSLALMYEGFGVNFSEDQDVKHRFYYRLHQDEADHGHFWFTLQKIYGKEMNRYFRRRKDDFNYDFSELIRLDIEPSNGKYLKLDNLVDLKQATKVRILRSGVYASIQIRLDFAKELKEKLLSKSSKSQRNINKLLLI